MDITHLSVDQLKSLAYDTKKEIERHEQNLAVIEQQLSLTVQAEAQRATEEAAANATPAPTEPGVQPNVEQPEQPGAGSDDGEQIEVRTGDEAASAPKENE